MKIDRPALAVLLDDYRELAAAVLADAVLDLGRGSRKEKQEAKRFLQSADAQFWAEVAGHDPDHLAGLDLEAVTRKFFTPANGGRDTQQLMRFNHGNFATID